MSQTRQFALLVATLTLPFVAQAGVNSWTSTGPEGGFTTAVAASPQDSTLLLAGTAGGTYRSVNGGATWQLAVSPSSVPVNFTFNPVRPAQVCSANNNLLCSSDAGATFVYIGNDRQPPGNGARDLWFTRDGVYLYAATNMGRVSRTLSTDIGAAWTDVTGPWPLTSNTLTAMTGDPNDANALYVAVSGSGVYKTVNGGTSWTPAGAGPSSGIYLVNQIVVMPGNSNRVVIAANDGLYISTNGGASWAHPSGFGAARTVAIDPLHPDTVVAVMSGGGVVRSSNAGDTFSLVGSPLVSTYQPMRMEFDGGTPSRLLLASGDGPLISANVGLTFSPATSGIHSASLQALTSSDSGTVYAALNAGPVGIFRRTSTGWQAVNNANLFAALGNITVLYEVATAPQDGNVIYVAGFNDQIVKSVDGGSTWAQAANPLVNAGRSFRHIAIDPTNVAIAYAGSVNDGVYKTVDGGAHWIKQSTGLSSFISALTVDRNNPQVVYAGAVAGNTSVFKSVDGGATWSPTGAMAQQLGVNQIAIDPTDSRVVYAAMHDKLFKSTDAGATWSIPSTFAVPRGVHVDRERPSTVVAGYMSAFNGFMRSVDSGAGWEQVDWPAGFSTGNGINAMLVDRVRPGLVISGGFGTSIMEYEVAPDMVVTLAVPASIDIGATVNARMTVHNSAGLAPSITALRLVLPAWLTAAPAAPCSLAGQTVTCTVPGLRANDGTLTIDVPVTASTTPSASSDIVAQMDTREFDPDTSNNRVTVQAASVARADLAVTPVPGSRSVVRNAAVSLGLTASNTGPTLAPNARVTITMPAGITLTSSTTTLGACTGATQVICTLGSMPNGATATITLNGTATASGNAVIEAVIASDAVDAAATNNTGNATFGISEPAPAGGSGGSSGGGGGGGRFDWLLVGLLGMLAAARLAGQHRRAPIS
ncbi:MAG TPA: hypothetical protein VM146_14585 [Steroidobacteraceae bacterium]|nr:hypothetical protein [Steroidobacteraceae bacterium]